jgi:thiol-disulfide isomerase/thioredoxin
VSRRGALLALLGAGAGAAGLGVAWWQGRSAAQLAGDEVWSMRFRQPDGGELQLAAFRGRPMLLNFWATWCPPCIRELPLLDRFHRDQTPEGWQVVGLAVDSREPVVEFLKARPVGFPIGLAGLEGVDLSRGLGNASGALPFSVLFDRRGAVLVRKLGAIHAEDLQSWMTRGN